jgi:serine/threonine-protein kinase RsbW
MIGTGDYDDEAISAAEEVKTIKKWCFDKKISSDPDNCARVIKVLLDQLDSLQWENRDTFGIHMAVEEAVMNAICHGNDSDPQKHVHILMEICDKRFYARITDEGNGFDPDNIPDPTLEENLEKISGRGVMLMKSFVDRVTYNTVGNSVEMEKHRSS